MNKLLQRAEKLSKMEYPKVDIPVSTNLMFSDGSRMDVHLPHVKTSRTTGKVVPTACLSLEEAYELAIYEAARIQEENELLGRI